MKCDLTFHWYYNISSIIIRHWHYLLLLNFSITVNRIFALWSSRTPGSPLPNWSRSFVWPMQRTIFWTHPWRSVRLQNRLDIILLIISPECSVLPIKCHRWNTGNNTKMKNRSLFHLQWNKNSLKNASIFKTVFEILFGGYASPTKYEAFWWLALNSYNYLIYTFV